MVPISASARVVDEPSKPTPAKTAPRTSVKRPVRAPTKSPKPSAEPVRATSDDRLPNTLEQRSEGARRRAAYLLGGVVLLFGALYGASKCTSTEDTAAKVPTAPVVGTSNSRAPKPLLEPPALPVGEEVRLEPPTPPPSEVPIEPEPHAIIEPPVPPPAAPPAASTARTKTPIPATAAPQKTEAPPSPKAPPPAVEQPTQAPLPQSGDIYSP